MKKIIRSSICMVTILSIQAFKPVPEGYRITNPVDSSRNERVKIVERKKPQRPLINNKHFDQPVSNRLAMDCVISYQKKGEIANQGKKTESIEFASKDLQEWMEKLKDSTTYNAIRIFPGIYTKEFLKKYHKSDTLENRLTVFLFPYNDGKPAVYNSKGNAAGGEGKPVDPFNLGNVHP